MTQVRVGIGSAAADVVVVVVVIVHHGGNVNGFFGVFVGFFDFLLDVLFEDLVGIHRDGFGVRRQHVGSRVSVHYRGNRGQFCHRRRRRRLLGFDRSMLLLLVLLFRKLLQSQRMLRQELSQKQITLSLRKAPGYVVMMSDFYGGACG